MAAKKVTGGGKVSKTSVNYRLGSGTKRCMNCTMYRDYSCTLVRGNIDPHDTCDEFERRK